MIWVFAAVAVGVCTGVVMADARTPHSRTLPLLSAFVLGASLALVLVFMNKELPYLGLVFTFGLILGQVAYVSWRWKKLFPTAGLTYWQILGYEFIHPNRVRQQYAAMLAEREEPTHSEIAGTPN